MSAIKCGKCGGLTNTAVCDWSLKPTEVRECYAKVEKGVWVKGCGYDHMDPYMKIGVNRLLGKPCI